MKMKRLLIFTLILSLLFGTQGAFASANIYKGTQAIVSGKTVSTMKSGNVLMVPAKDVFTGLGLKVTYDTKTNKMTVKGKRTFEFTSGKKVFKAGSASLNMDASATVVKNVFYVPAHVVGQVTGYEGKLSGNKLTFTASKQTALNVGTISGPTGIAMAKMMNESYLGEQVKVNYGIESNAQLLPAKLLKKELDIAFVPTNMASIVYNKSKGEVVLLSTNIWGLLSVVTTDPKVKTWDDLKGKQIDIFGQGATPEIAFKALAESHDLNPKKDMTYKMAYDTPGTLVAALASGKTKDGIGVLAEPFTSMLLAKNKNARIISDFQSEWKRSYQSDFPMSSIVVRKDYLNAHPEIVSAFVREFSNSLAYANKNPKEIGKFVKMLPELPFESSIVAASIPRSDFRYVSAPNAKTAVNKYLQILYLFDKATVGGKLPSNDFYTKVPVTY